MILKPPAPPQRQRPQTASRARPVPPAPIEVPVSPRTGNPAIPSSAETQLSSPRTAKTRPNSAKIVPSLRFHDEDSHHSSKKATLSSTLSSHSKKNAVLSAESSLVHPTTTAAPPLLPLTRIVVRSASLQGDVVLPHRLHGGDGVPHQHHIRSPAHAPPVVEPPAENLADTPRNRKQFLLIPEDEDETQAHATERKDKETPRLTDAEELAVHHVWTEHVLENKVIAISRLPDLMSLFQNLHVRLLPEIEQLIAEFFEAYARRLDFDHFQYLVLLARCRHQQLIEQHPQLTDDLLEAFVALGGEEDSQGTVDNQLVRSTIRQYQLGIDYDLFLQMVDTDGNQEVDFEEFRCLVNEGNDALVHGSMRFNMSGAESFLGDSTRPETTVRIPADPSMTNDMQGGASLSVGGNTIRKSTHFQRDQASGARRHSTCTTSRVVTQQAADFFIDLDEQRLTAMAATIAGLCVPHKPLPRGVSTIGRSSTSQSVRRVPSSSIMRSTTEEFADSDAAALSITGKIGFQQTWNSGLSFGATTTTTAAASRSFRPTDGKSFFEERAGKGSASSTALPSAEFYRHLSRAIGHNGPPIQVETFRSRCGQAMMNVDRLGNPLPVDDHQRLLDAAEEQKRLNLTTDKRTHKQDTLSANRKRVLALREERRKVREEKVKQFHQHREEQLRMSGSSFTKDMLEGSSSSPLNNNNINKSLSVFSDSPNSKPIAGGGKGSHHRRDSAAARRRLSMESLDNLAPTDPFARTLNGEDGVESVYSTSSSQRSTNHSKAGGEDDDKGLHERLRRIATMASQKQQQQQQKLPSAKGRRGSTTGKEGNGSATRFPRRGSVSGALLAENVRDRLAVSSTPTTTFSSNTNQYRCDRMPADSARDEEVKEEARKKFGLQSVAGITAENMTSRMRAKVLNTTAAAKAQRCIRDEHGRDRSEVDAKLFECYYGKV